MQRMLDQNDDDSGHGFPEMASFDSDSPIHTVTTALEHRTNTPGDSMLRDKSRGRIWLPGFSISLCCSCALIIKYIIYKAAVIF